MIEWMMTIPRSSAVSEGTMTEQELNRLTDIVLAVKRDPRDGMAKAEFTTTFTVEVVDRLLREIDALKAGWLVAAETALEPLLNCDLNDDNCASWEVANKRIRSIARSALSAGKRENP